MGRQIRVELSPRNEFWRNAFFVEWAHQFPDRELAPDPTGHLLVPETWFSDLERVAVQCLSAVKLAPSDPGRRRMLRALFPTGQTRQG